MASGQRAFIGKTKNMIAHESTSIEIDIRSIAQAITLSCLASTIAFPVLSLKEVVPWC